MCTIDKCYNSFCYGIYNAEILLKMLTSTECCGVFTNKKKAILKKMQIILKGTEVHDVKL